MARSVGTKAAWRSWPPKSRGLRLSLRLLAALLVLFTLVSFILTCLVASNVVLLNTSRIVQRGGKDSASTTIGGMPTLKWDRLYSSFLPNIEEKLQDYRFASLLQSAVMLHRKAAKKLVVVTTFTASQKEILDVWLTRMQQGHRTAQYLPHVVVLCFDAEGYALCKAQKGKGLRHCHLEEVDVAVNGSGMSKESGGGEKAHVQMMGRRLQLLAKVVRAGYSLLVTDINVMWFQDPLPWLGGDHDMIFSCEKWSPTKEQVVPSLGFWFSRSSKRTREFFKYWLQARERGFQSSLGSGQQEQDIFARIRPESDPFTAHTIGLQVKYLQTDRFGSHCQPQPAGQLASLVTFHSACVQGNEKELSVMRSVLGDYERAIAKGHNGTSKALPVSLGDLLDSAATDNNCVVVTAMLRTRQSRLLEVFVTRMRRNAATSALLPHLVVLTFDANDWKGCSVLGLTCFLDSENPAPVANSSEPARTGAYLREIGVLQQKVSLLLRIVRGGYCVLYTDLSVIWFKDPFPRLGAHDDLQLAAYPGAEAGAADKQEPNTAFWFARSNSRTETFFEFWIQHADLRLHRQTPARLLEREALRRILPAVNPFVADGIGLKVRFLEQAIFGSLCDPRAAVEAVATLVAMDPFCFGGKPDGSPKIGELLESQEGGGSGTKAQKEVKRPLQELIDNEDETIVQVNWLKAKSRMYRPPRVTDVRSHNE